MQGAWNCSRTHTSSRRLSTCLIWRYGLAKRPLHHLRAQRWTRGHLEYGLYETFAALSIWRRTVAASLARWPAGEQALTLLSSALKAYPALLLVRYSTERTVVVNGRNEYMYVEIKEPFRRVGCCYVGCWVTRLLSVHLAERYSHRVVTPGECSSWTSCLRLYVHDAAKDHTLAKTLPL